MAKVGRNDPCPCNSGRKYKKCCLGKGPEIIVPRFDIGGIRRGAELKICLHPNQEDCSERIVKAHSIQLNRILNKIADQGKVLMIDSNLNPHNLAFELDLKEIGQKAATTFQGFCVHHDKITFQDIEDKDFSSDPKQCFLFAYRAFALELYKKLHIRRFLENQGLKSSGMYKGNELAIRDLEYMKNIFDQSLINGEFDNIESYVYVLGAEHKLALCSPFAPSYDLMGKPLNILSQLDKRVRTIFLNIFPQDGKTYFVFSWLKEDSEFFKEFIYQLKMLDEPLFINFINNLIPLYFENFVTSPGLWQKLTPGERTAFLQNYKDNLIGEAGRDKLLEKPNFNLFSD